MLKTIVLLIIGILPAIWSWWVIHKTQQQRGLRTRQIVINYSPREQYIRPVEGDRYYLETVGYLIGDISCKFNARSGYIRCAINPSGPCQNCLDYQPTQDLNIAGHR